jgi:DNA-binding CsgD family transcriptional regulator
VFICTFGFYGIWGQVLLRFLLSANISEEVLTRVSEIALLIGLPFLIFAWLMLLQFSSLLAGAKRDNWFVSGFLLFNILIIVGMGYLIGKEDYIKPLYLIKQYFLVVNFIYTAVAASQIFFSGRESYLISVKEKKIIASGIFIVLLVQSGLLIFFTEQTYLGILFILAYFIGNAFLPVYITYGMDIVTYEEDPVKELSFEEFCKKYDVSPRESDIVRQICNGLSNKEISEKLFITLQTVKDHTHRIYIKTNVKSRAQLMNLVKNHKKD